MSIQQLEDLALRLPRDERARLARHLIASLDDDSEAEEAWTAEATRRLEALRSGAAEAIPAADALADARRAVR